ncbi:hypothetical protein I7I50_00120 [Histoplasma capsulatum G186AR]|uniref:Uncharacterized protein n=1 Tax=Ajellomyces capsulatus TaxID=5037 RepID=A0A8H7YIH9_AJECA|nr:hypothetical protein I7I52_07389 [Histoplasma capsulatum]QSS72312.1 hypothetical protein I7I50_00120 [Histoplasma capsulatum G186AR]
MEVKNFCPIVGDLKGSGSQLKGGWPRCHNLQNVECRCTEDRSLGGEAILKYSYISVQAVLMQIFIVD